MHPIKLIKFGRGIRDQLRIGANRTHWTKLVIVWGYPGPGKSYDVTELVTEDAMGTRTIRR